MEPSSQIIRTKISSNSLEVNPQHVNSQHDYRKLPRSSGDGMESRRALIDKGQISNRQMTKTAYKEVSSVSENFTHSPRTQLPDSVSGKTTRLPVPNVVDRETCDSPLQTFKPRNDNYSSSYYPITGMNHYSENTSSTSVSGSLSTGVCQNTDLYPVNITPGVKTFSLERKAECLDLNSLIKELECKNQVLTAEKEKLSSKLLVQSKVNADLKKLLVASVGEDIGARLEEMVADKTQFDSTLKNLETQVEKAEEELGRVSIECDVWRTKFLASSMMTNGLTDIKTTLYLKHRNCQAVLQKLLEEQSDIRQHLRATNRLLQGIHNKTNATQSTSVLSWEKTFQKSSIMELAHVNYNLAEDICYSLNPSHFYATINNNSSAEEEIIPVTDLTPAEQMACQVLKNNTDNSTEMDLVMEKMGRQYIGNSYASRFLTNNFRVTFDCCDRCAGALKVV